MEKSSRIQVNSKKAGSVSIECNYNNILSMQTMIWSELTGNCKRVYGNDISAT